MNKITNFIKKYPLLFIGLSLLIFITIILVITAINMRKTEEIEVLVAPISAEITIDGKEYQNGTFNIEPGEHQVHIEKTGFISQDFSFNTLSTRKIYTYLKQTDGSYSWYSNNSEDSNILTQIGDYEADREAELYSSQNPIVQVLPIFYAHYDENYNYSEFRIDGGEFDGCESNFCLKVTDTTGGNMELAKNKIKEAGYNPNNYQILYEYKPIQPLE